MSHIFFEVLGMQNGIHRPHLKKLIHSRIGRPQMRTILIKGSIKINRLKNLISIKI